MPEHNTTDCLLFPDIFDRPVVAKFDQRQGSSDGGAILLTAERRLGLTAALTTYLRDDRQAGKVQHELRELLTQRVMAIALGYEDANDAARLASDPIHKLLVGRDPVNGEDLASQPTLSRFENAPDRKELLRMTEALADCVIERHRKRFMVGPVASRSIWIPPTTPRTASNSSPFSIATTIATVICRWFVFSPLMRRPSSTWWRRCCGVGMRLVRWVRGDSAPSDCSVEQCFSQGQNPGAARRRLCVPRKFWIFWIVNRKWNTWSTWPPMRC